MTLELPELESSDPMNSSQWRKEWVGERASALSPDRGDQGGTSLLALGFGLLSLLRLALRRVNVSSHCGYLLVRVRDDVDE